MHPNDYRVELSSDNIRKTKQYTSYYGDHYGPGKGFGNTNVSNQPEMVYQQEMRTKF